LTRGKGPNVCPFSCNPALKPSCGPFRYQKPRRARRLPLGAAGSGPGLPRPTIRPTAGDDPRSTKNQTWPGIFSFLPRGEPKLPPAAGPHGILIPPRHRHPRLRAGRRSTRRNTNRLYVNCRKDRRVDLTYGFTPAPPQSRRRSPPNVSIPRLSGTAKEGCWLAIRGTTSTAEGRPTLLAPPPPQSRAPGSGRLRNHHSTGLRQLGQQPGQTPRSDQDGSILERASNRSRRCCGLLSSNHWPGEDGELPRRGKTTQRCLNSNVDEWAKLTTTCTAKIGLPNLGGGPSEPGPGAQNLFFA